MPSGMYLCDIPGKKKKKESWVYIKVVTFMHFFSRILNSSSCSLKICEHYLDQPKSGGAAQARAMIQVKRTPAAAWVPVNLKLPMGLQTTMYLSTARTTRDQRATSPAGREEDKKLYTCVM